MLDEKYLVLNDMTVDDEGNIYAVDFYSDEVLKFDPYKKEMTRFSSDEKFKRPHMIQYLPSGKLMIEDSVDSENATRVSKFDKYGKKLTEKKLSNMINMSLFQYEDELDKTFDIAQSGYMNLQISVTDTKKNKIKGISNVDFLSEITEYDRGVCLFGVDKKRVGLLSNS